MKRVHAVGQTIPLTALLLVSLAVTGALAAYTAFFLTSNPATVTVTVNSFSAELYSDATLTTPVTSLDFGSLMQGSTATFTCYLALLYPDDLAGKDVRALWRAPDLPAGMTLTAEWLNGGTWMTWAEGSYTLTLSVDYPYREVRFTLAVNDVATGTYSFTMEIETGEWA